MSDRRRVRRDGERGNKGRQRRRERYRGMRREGEERKEGKRWEEGKGREGKGREGEGRERKGIVDKLDRLAGYSNHRLTSVLISVLLSLTKPDAINDTSMV